jgi:hypothetical protein
LNRRVGNHPTVRALIESKDSLKLVKGNAFLDLDHILVQIADVLAVSEDEGLLRVEAESDDVFDVAHGVLLNFLKSVVLSEQELLIISYLNDEGHIKSLLQVGSENHRNRVSQVHGLIRGASPSVQIKELPLLVEVQDLVQVTVAEEDVPSQEPVKLLSCKNGDFFNELGRDSLAAELVSELVVVDTCLLLHLVVVASTARYDLGIVLLV